MRGWMGAAVTAESACRGRGLRILGPSAPPWASHFALRTSPCQGAASSRAPQVHVPPFLLRRSSRDPRSTEEPSIRGACTERQRRPSASQSALAVGNPDAAVDRDTHVVDRAVKLQFDAAALRWPGTTPGALLTHPASVSMKPRRTSRSAGHRRGHRR